MRSLNIEPPSHMPNSNLSPAAIMPLRRAETSVRGGFPNHRWSLWLALAATTFSSRNLIGPSWLVTGDVLLAISILAFSLQTRAGSGFRLHKSLSWMLAVAVAASISAAFNFGSTGFLPVEATKFFAKMALYTVGMIVTLTNIRVLSWPPVASALRWAIGINLVFSLAQQVGHRIGTSVPLFQGYSSGPWDRSVWPRTQGLFSEPATLSIFILVSLLVLFAIDQLRGRDLVIGAFILVLAASVLGAILSCLAVIAVVVDRRRLSQRTMLRFFVGCLVVVAVLASVAPVRQAFLDRVYYRLESTLTDPTEDASGSGRLFDSWSAATTVASESPIVGVGPGNYERQLRIRADAGGLNDVDPRLVDSQGGWNLFANVFAELGILGVVIVAILLVRWAYHWKVGLVMLIGLTFATGTFVGWSWWLSCLLLGPALQNRSRWDPTIDLRTPTVGHPPATVPHYPRLISMS